MMGERYGPNGPPSYPEWDDSPSGPGEPGRPWWSHLLRGLGVSTIVLAALMLLTLASASAAYAYYALTLPSPTDLGSRSTFMSTKVYDRHGTLLYEIFDPKAGRRTMVPIEQIPLHLRMAAIATEDQSFYSNSGVDPKGILRAMWQNIRGRSIVSGASTITQQLVKNVYLDPEVSISRKLKEAFLAAEITRRYSKDQILEMYLNEIYYGNLAYGIEAAAETYFGKRAEDLNLAECSLLAGLPQAPAIYDPYVNLEDAKARQATVLELMVGQGFIAPAQAEAALAEELQFIPLKIDMRAPHFVMYVRELLERQYGPEGLYRGGLQVYTTLDLEWQELAQEIATGHVQRLAEHDVGNAAVVAMDPATGEILTMLGSVDFFDEEIDGQVNVTIRLRQPGSSIKPINYIAAFERGWTPATMIMDVKENFSTDPDRPYEPENYDGKEHGPVSLRRALACSYNIPAVRTLQFVTVPGMIEVAERMGITTFTDPQRYGLALTLGGGEVTLLEMSGAYSAMANGGRKVDPVAILKVTNHEGRTLYEHQFSQGKQVIDPQHAYLITDILADNEARTPAFGPNSVLRLSRPAAAKTGTTDDWKDNWTIGYTPDLVVGVWAGNSDNSPMKHVSGVTGAGPIWHDFMEEALRDEPPGDFVPPPGLETAEVCALSGMAPTDLCPERRREIFASGTVPQDECSMHLMVRFCPVTSLWATELCPEGGEEEPFVVFPEKFREWAEKAGIPQPPPRCDLHTSASWVEITSPSEDEHVSGVVQVMGSAVVPDFQHYVVEYGIGPDPIGWGLVAGDRTAPVEQGSLADWDTRGLSNGVHSLRVVAYDNHGNGREARVRVVVDNFQPPTPIPTRAPTRTPMPPPTETLVPTDTPAPTETALPTGTASPTATPTKMGLESPTPTLTQSPTPSATPAITATISADEWGAGEAGE